MAVRSTQACLEILILIRVEFVRKSLLSKENNLIRFMTPIFSSELDFNYNHYYISFLCDLNISLFSCALFLSSFTDADFLTLMFSFLTDLSTSLPPLGLRLESRFFFDLDSDLEVPRITLEIF